MRYQYHSPSTDKAAYVKTILTVEEMIPGEIRPVLPMGVPALVCHISDKPGEANPKVNLQLFGKGISHGVIHSNYILLAIFFKPFMANTIFRIPARDWNNRPLDLWDWNAAQAGLLEKNLIPAQTVAEKRDILKGFIQEWIGKNKRLCEIIRQATDQIMLNPDGGALSKIREELDIGERSLQRLFK